MIVRNSATKVRSRITKAIITVSIVVLTSLVLTGCQLTPSLVTPQSPASIPSHKFGKEAEENHNGTISDHVSIWYPPTSCNGIFRNAVARDSPGGFPYAILRDAVVDRRPASKRILGKGDGSGVSRIVLYMTTHLSARISEEDNLCSFDEPGITCDVEYVTHVAPFVIPRVSGGYRPGLKTHYGQEVTEFQVGIALRPAEVAANGVFQNPAQMRSLLRVNLTTVRFDGQKFPFHASLPIHCALGWGSLPGKGDRRSTCGKDAADATGAILFSGSALYGAKKRERKYYREVANFAARGLLGPLQFDAVAMAVTSNYSYSDIHERCGSDINCVYGMEEGNNQLLRNVAEVVEEELDLIGVPRKLFSRVMIIPLCRLGSDANGTEANDNCRESKRYGQYHATFFSHTMLAPFYKWAASYDMDEFVAEAPRISKPNPKMGITEYVPGQPKVESAATILDGADENTAGDRGHLVFQWLNFKVGSPNDSRTLSKNLIHGILPTLRHRYRPSDSPWCYKRTLIPTGKSAVRCDVGLGFTIHHPVISKDGKLMEQQQSWRFCHDLRTWHPRFHHLSSSCDYIPPKSRTPL